jgi:hypothetical protein
VHGGKLSGDGTVIWSSEIAAALAPVSGEGVHAIGPTTQTTQATSFIES